MSADLSQFYQTFFDETAEHLASMEKLLLALDVNNPAMDDLNAIFRSAHSIKGGAATFGFEDMAGVTHVLETLLDKLRKQEMTLTAEMINVFLQTGDVIAMQLAAHSGESEAQVDANAVTAVCKKLEQLSLVVGSAKKEIGQAPVDVAKSSENSDSGFFDDQPDAPAPLPSAVKETPPPPLMKIPGGRATHDIHGQGFGFFDEEPAPASKLPPPANTGAGKEQAVFPSRKEIPKSGMSPASAEQVQDADSDFGLFESQPGGPVSTPQSSNAASDASDTESTEEKAKRDFHGKGFGFF